LINIFSKKYIKELFIESFSIGLMLLYWEWRKKSDSLFDFL